MQHHDMQPIDTTATETAEKTAVTVQEITEADFLTAHPSEWSHAVYEIEHADDNETDSSADVDYEQQPPPQHAFTEVPVIEVIEEHAEGDGRMAESADGIVVEVEE